MRAYRAVLLVVVVAAVAFNLRPAITSVGPLLPDIRTALHTSATWAGVLTTLPVLCFAGAGLAAPWLARRLGLIAVISVALATLAAGLAARVGGGAATVLAGTLVATAGIALVNVLIPVVVTTSFPRRMGLVTGIYTAALQFGGASGAALTPVFADRFGGWRAGLGAWAVPAAVVVPVWAVMHNRVGRVDSARHARDGHSLVTSPLAWAVTVLFGTQAFVAYAVMGWLPAVFIDNGMSKVYAGLLLSLTALIAVPLSIVVTPLAARRISQSGWLVGLSSLGVAGVLGLVLAPMAAPLLWSVLVGFGMSVFSLSLAVISLRTRNTVDTTRLSAMAQGLGYLLAGAGPLLFGVLHDATGAWTVPWLLVLVVAAVQTTVSFLAGRNAHI